MKGCLGFCSRIHDLENVRSVEDGDCNISILRSIGDDDFSLCLVLMNPSVWWVICRNDVCGIPLLLP